MYSAGWLFSAEWVMHVIVTKRNYEYHEAELLEYVGWVQGSIQDLLSCFHRSHALDADYLHANVHPLTVYAYIYKSINGSSTFCTGAAWGAAGKLSGPYPPIA